jgi:hypothetical protein
MFTLRSRSSIAFGRYGITLSACLLASAAAAPVWAQSSGPGFAMLTDNLDAPTSADGTGATSTGATAETPAFAMKAGSKKSGTGAIKKVTAGSNFEIQVDNGWVMYEGLNNNPTLNFYDVDANKLGAFKLVTPGAGAAQGYIYQGGGIVFGPCPIASGTRCNTSEGGTTGVGIGFGQVDSGGTSAGGWVNDSNLVEHRTNPDFVQGSIAATAINAPTAAFAVGWDDDATGVARATALTLDAAGETYAPIAQTDLGTLGGPTSQAFGISTDTTYTAGIAQTTANKYHAVYAVTASTASGCGGNAPGTVSTCWVDLAPFFPAGSGISKSRALVANGNGYIAGSAVVKRMVAGRDTQVDIGFVFNVNTSTMTLFEEPGANVVPLRVLSDGSVVGNLQYILPKGTGGLPVYHPFLYQGGTVTDFGLLTNATTGAPEYSCRVNKPNDVGELVGSCIPNGSTAFGAGTAFYLNTLATTPTYVDLNADLHTMNDAANPLYKNYTYGAASSIDDEHEITVMGFETTSGGTTQRGAFLAEPGSY